MTGAGAPSRVDVALDGAWREHWARLLAALVARYRRPDLAEDALADAFAAAARTWPTDGVPANPAGWLRHMIPQLVSKHSNSSGKYINGKYAEYVEK